MRTTPFRRDSTISQDLRPDGAMRAPPHQCIVFASPTPWLDSMPDGVMDQVSPASRRL
jgi:hypothetical protein